MSQDLETMKLGIQQIMAGAKRVDPVRLMPADEVWQRQAQMILEQRSAALLSTLSESEIKAVASGQISMSQLWAKA